MIDTVIVSGGNINRDFALDFLKKHKDSMWIAADKGMEFFEREGLLPRLWVGDFDSVQEEVAARYERHPQVEVVRLKPQKDDSDTQSALNLAIARGAKEAAILGGTGTRLDHVLANLGLLTSAEQRGVKVILADSHNWIELVKSGRTLKKKEQFGKYVSFFPVGGDVPGLTLEGFLYPLKEHHLTAADGGFTVSNEILDEEARVFYKGGSLLMLMTRD